MILKKSAFFDFLNRFGDHDFETFLARSEEDIDYINWHDFCLISAYRDASSEYQAVRNSCALFDASPVKKYRFTGRDAGLFIDVVMSRQISALKPMYVGYATFCNDNGMLRDDGLLYKFAEDDYLLMVSEIDHDDYFASVSSRFPELSIEEVTPSLAGLAVQGPRSCAVLKSFGFDSLETLRPFEIRTYAFKDSSVIIARVGFTADLGYELWCVPELTGAVEQAFIEAEQSLDLKIPGYGLEALNALRLEGGFVVPGWETAQEFENDEDERTPAELGIGWTVDLKREEEFIGKAALVKEQELGPRYATIGLKIDDRRKLEEGSPLYFEVNTEGGTIGEITSIAWSHGLDCHVALASIEAGRMAEQGLYYLFVDGERIDCRVVRLPFVNLKRYRQTPAPVS